MNILVKAIAVALMALSIPVAQAMDGNDLLAGYNSYKRVESGNATGRDAYDGAVFDGYVSGVFDSTVDRVLCMPGDVKNGQIQEVVGQFLEANPAYRQRSAVLNVTHALMKAFPCK